MTCPSWKSSVGAANQIQYIMYVLRDCRQYRHPGPVDAVFCHCKRSDLCSGLCSRVDCRGCWRQATSCLYAAGPAVVRVLPFTGRSHIPNLPLGHGRQHLGVLSRLDNTILWPADRGCVPSTDVFLCFCVYSRCTVHRPQPRSDPTPSAAAWLPIIRLL